MASRKEHSMSTELSETQRLAAVPPAVLSAADFTDAIMYAAPVPAPRRGWRRAVYESSAHLVNPGPSAAEQQRAELERRLRTPISGSRRVVVMSRKGGVGKTTISLALGSTFAMLRGDRVIAVDANPDAGNLAHRVAPPHDKNITDVLRDLDADHQLRHAAFLHLTGSRVATGGPRVRRRPAHRDGAEPGGLPPAGRPARPVLQPDPARHRAPGSWTAPTRACSPRPTRSSWWCARAWTAAGRAP